MYKTITLDGKIVSLEKQDGNILMTIPFDPANTDYQEYLKWVAEGNEPEPADTQE
jgi:hypothetical protein